MKIVVMGAPGCGKGTQSPMLTERYHVCHLSTGDLLRDAVANRTPNGLAAKAAMDAGQLVTDDIVFGILKDNISSPKCVNGWVLDGLPRTLTQAQKMEAQGIIPDRVIQFEVPDEKIVQRTSGRWIHRASGRTYHSTFAPPKVAGKDDVTGEPLMQRADDREEVVRKRLELYHREVGPIHDFYRQRGVLRFVNGDRTVAEVRDSLRGLLDPLTKWWPLHV